LKKSSVGDRKALEVEYVDKIAAAWANFLNFVKTPHLKKMMGLEHAILFILAGNQAGKTSNTAFDYIARILGIHPVEEKNRLSKNIRCLSSSLPESADADEQDNTQYLELKKLLPYEAILKDITARSRTVTISSPVHGKSYLEFVSTKQELQDTGKVQRCSLWADEEPPRPYWDESRMRLHARGGDTRLTLTPINGLSWTYDDIYRRASYIWRSKAIVDALAEPQEEHIKGGSQNIAVIHIATDDNPTLTKESIDMIFEDIDDKDTLMLRRYGVFRQVSGKIHKTFDPRIHVLSYDRTFPGGVPMEWLHCRGIEYHESRIPWSIGWLSASPEDEWFLWKEFHPAIDGAHAMTTPEIARSIARKSGDYYFDVNLIDPLANKKQANTGFSVTDDLNRLFDEMHQNEGLGTPCYWKGWDTKDTKGRDEVRKRFKNAKEVGKPFNNMVKRHGVFQRIPTLWIMDTCPNFVKSIQRWSYNEWATVQSKSSNDPKDSPQQKWSHDNMVVECLAKDVRLIYNATNRPIAGLNDHKYSQTGRPCR